MTFGEAVSTCFKKYAVFQGRASRSEFWWFQLFVCLAVLALLVLALLAGIAQFVPELEEDDDVLRGLAVLLSLPFWLPFYAVGARRLHDSGKSGWLQLLGFIPFLGIIVFVLYALKGDEGPNRYGDDPLAGGHFSGNRIVDDVKLPYEAKNIVLCPKCAQKIAAPPGGRLQLTCPTCQTQFEVLP